MNIAYVTEFDLKKFTETKSPPKELGHRGRCYYIAKSLEEQSIKINYVGPLARKPAVLPKLKECFYNNFLHKVYHKWADPIFSKNYAEQICHQLYNHQPDILVSPDVNLISYLDCRQKIVLWVDTLYEGLINFYPDYINLCQETIQHLTTLDRLSLKRCSLAIFSSEWAANTAIEKYKIELEKVKVIPSGANIKCTRDIDDIRQIVEAKSTNKCKLLFLGVDWFRKGGNIALEVTNELNKAGINTELTVVGCQPITKENEAIPDFVVNLGFISKSNPEGFNKINALIAKSHFLIMPSQAETYGNVFCEANSFGVPCISTDVGGIPTIIKEGLNGKTFAKNASTNEYSNYIFNIFSDYAKYKQLALSSFHEYETRLNWNVAGKTAKKLLMDLL